MDIGHNLFYNENTVHSGNFLEGLIWFGKETMRRMMKINILALSVCILLCGCTRREQLVLENFSEEREWSADLQAAEEQGESEAPDLQEQGTFRVQGPKEHDGVDESGKIQTIFVHVCGAVMNPDVYELSAGSRVYEAVQAAGGFTDDADENYVNQAQILSDGLKLVIPTVEQTSAKESEDTENNLIGIVGETGSAGGQSITDMGADTSSDGKVNINTASEAELCNIPGIGAVRAAAIVAYRQEKGSFSSIEDIMNVSGIKEGTYEKIKDSIKIN